MVAMAILAGLLGCSQEPEQDVFLLRVGAQSITVAEFNQSVDMASEDAFAGEVEQKSEEFKELRLRVLNQLTEELIILEKARELGISISEPEVDQAVDQIKADYPDNTFEETLLENAVSFAIWRKRMASRLLVEKVIAAELVEQATISPEDVAQYYQTHYPEGPPEQVDGEDVNKRVVTHLRKQKAEQSYKAWIENLRTVYPVELNRKQWDRLIGEGAVVH